MLVDTCGGALILPLRSLTVECSLASCQEGLPVVNHLNCFTLYEYSIPQGYLSLRTLP